MSKLKKLGSMLLALVFAIGMTCTALAADTTGTITIDNAANGETYSIYKMLNLSYNEETKSYSYTVAEGWESFFNSQTGFTVDADGYVTSTLDSNSSEMATVAKAALAYAANNNIAATATAVAGETGTVTFSNLALGYYLVDTSLGTLCSINTTDTTVTIKDKNNDSDDEPGFDKDVSNDNGETYVENNSASIGDTLTYKITVSNVDDKSSVKVSDTLSSGLTLNISSITVTVNGVAVPTSNYTLDTTTANSFTITFTDSYLAGMTSDIVITYTATVNANAQIGVDANTNKAILDYGNNQKKEDTVKTSVFEFELKKVDDNGNQLTGATFTLKDSGKNAISVSKEDDGTYIVDNDGTDTITVGTTTISGLAAGTYYLTEETAPDGYNKLSSDITVVIDDKGNVTVNGKSATTVEIVNEAGSSLPTTGGMGTTIFYIVGGVLAAGAVVLLITKKRMAE